MLPKCRWRFRPLPAAFVTIAAATWLVNQRISRFFFFVLCARSCLRLTIPVVPVQQALLLPAHAAAGGFAAVATRLQQFAICLAARCLFRIRAGPGRTSVLHVARVCAGFPPVFAMPKLKTLISQHSVRLPRIPVARTGGRVCVF